MFRLNLIINVLKVLDLSIILQCTILYIDNCVDKKRMKSLYVVQSESSRTGSDSLFKHPSLKYLILKIQIREQVLSLFSSHNVALII